MKKLVWNKVTWYSKLLTAIFFIFVVPILTFKIGTEYENTKIILQNFTVSDTEQSEITEESDKTRAQEMNSGIVAQVTTVDPACALKVSCKGVVYKGYISIKTIQGKLITSTKIRDDGTFLAILSPGTYKIFPLSEVPMPSIKPIVITIKQGVVGKESIRFVVES